MNGPRQVTVLCTCGPEKGLKTTTSSTSPDRLLDSCGENARARSVRRHLDSIRAGRHQGLYEVRNGYGYNGGCGSMMDLIICWENGHTIDSSEVGDVNDRFNAALLDATSLARQISHEALKRVRPKQAT